MFLRYIVFMLISLSCWFGLVSVCYACVCAHAGRNWTLIATFVGLTFNVYYRVVAKFNIWPQSTSAYFC